MPRFHSQSRLNIRATRASGAFEQGAANCGPSSATAEPKMLPKIPTTAIFYFNGTFLERTNGAHLRAASLIFFLQQRFERVILYSYANHPTCPWSDGLIEKFKVMYPSVPLILEDSTGLIRIATRLKNF